MAMNVASSSGGGGRRGRRKPVVAEINVTPMVDVMLVLLIIFMVSAPMLTVGVPLDLPQTQAKSLENNDQKPIQMSVDIKGKVFINDAEIAINELIPKLKAITDARSSRSAHVLVEKPFTISAEDAWDLVRTARRVDATSWSRWATTKGRDRHSGRSGAGCERRPR